MRGRSLWVTLIVVAGLAVISGKYLVGCSDSPFAVSTSTTTTTATVTTLPTPTTSNTLPPYSTTTTSTTTTTIVLSWTLMTAAPGFPARSNHAGTTTRLNTHRYIFVVGGNTGSLTNDAWALVDGSVWAQATPEAAFSSREGHTVVAQLITDSISLPYLIGGIDQSGTRKNDVWCASDYYNWILITAEAPFSARSEHAGVRFEYNAVSYMWVIGGNSRVPD